MVIEYLAAAASYFKMSVRSVLRARETRAFVAFLLKYDSRMIEKDIAIGLEKPIATIEKDISHFRARLLGHGLTDMEHQLFRFSVEQIRKIAHEICRIDAQAPTIPVQSVKIPRAYPSFHRQMPRA